jgi:hypothetical protein
VTSPAACLIALLAAGPPPEAPDAARQVLQRGRYQTDLPVATGPAARPETAVRARRSQGSDRAASDRGSKPVVRLPPANVVWGVFAFLIVIGLVWAVRQASRSRRGADVPPAPAPEAPRAPPRARLRIGPLTDVEELARQGRFGEAIHLLLLHLFAALQRRPATAPAPAHTGREVLARTTLTSEARSALGVLVGAAEAVHFGGRTAAREDYENCLGHYRRFLDAFERAS